MKRILCLFITIIVLFTTIPLSACTEEISLNENNYTKYIDIQYKLENCVADNNNLYCSLIVSFSSKDNSYKFSNAKISFRATVTNFHSSSHKNGDEVILDKEGKGEFIVSLNSSSATRFPTTRNIKFTLKKISGSVSKSLI